MSSDGDVLERLMEQVHERAQTRPAGSYTTKLVEGGIPKMAGKLREETAEVIEAAEQYAAALQAAGRTPEQAGLESGGQAGGSDTVAAAREHLIYEAGDVLYHLWVLLGSQGITLEEIRRELARREGTSGLEEKRRRSESA
jgi:phosphoribosyl-ATP pyrophosphohydrolase